MPINAVFIGYQEGIDEMKPYALFDVYWGGNEKDRSSVDANELVYLGIPVPIAPSYEKWKYRDEK